MILSESIVPFLIINNKKITAPILISDMKTVIPYDIFTVVDYLSDGLV